MIFSRSFIHTFGSVLGHLCWPDSRIRTPFQLTHQFRSTRLPRDVTGLRRLVFVLEQASSIRAFEPSAVLMCSSAPSASQQLPIFLVRGTLHGTEAELESVLLSSLSLSYHIQSRQGAVASFMVSSHCCWCRIWHASKTKSIERTQ